MIKKFAMQSQSLVSTLFAQEHWRDLWVRSKLDMLLG